MNVKYIYAVTGNREWAGAMRATEEETEEIRGILPEENLCPEVYKILYLPPSQPGSLDCDLVYFCRSESGITYIFSNVNLKGLCSKPITMPVFINKDRALLRKNTTINMIV